MRAYADSSFILRLVLPDSGASAFSTYRELGRPPLIFLPLHELEVYNGVLLRAFIDAESGTRTARASAERNRVAAESRLENLLKRRAFLRNQGDWDEAVNVAREISARRTSRIGARALDILHVAFAINLGAENFITSDERQGKLAKAEGLTVTMSID
jgi:predicted nucleic acid-binding protein